jgi:hypothetical protein
MANLRQSGHIRALRAYLAVFAHQQTRSWDVNRFVEGAFFMVCAVTVAACTSDPSTAGGDDENQAGETGRAGQPGDDGPTMPQGGASGGADGCVSLTDPETQFLLAPSELPQMGSVPSPVMAMSTDADSVYFSTLNSLYRLPLEGGSVHNLYEVELATSYMQHWPLNENVVALSRDGLVSAPKAGGDVALLEAFDDDKLRPATAVLMGESLIAKATSGGALDEPEEVTYFSHDLSSGMQTVLLETDRGLEGRLVVAGEDLFTTDDTGEAGAIGEDSLVSTLYRIPLAGGEATEISITPEMPRQFVVLAATDGELVLLSRNMGALSFELASVPLAGGPMTMLAKSGDTTFGISQVLAERTTGGVVVKTVSGFYWIADGASEALKFGCIDRGPGNKYTLHSFTVKDDTVYVGAYDGDTGKNAIVPIALPR